ncbi:hypothetical protein SDC9_87283 [bioreactor metagenome]|uniref:Uncharacterized protein n=1 Tax=bioreactor metagenome TaxID=1076179 RepID=A0A644ZIH6_9ZZZZ
MQPCHTSPSPGQPGGVRVERRGPAEEVLDQVGGVQLPAAGQDGVAVAGRDPGLEQVVGVERGEQVLGDHLGPGVRVVAAGVAVEMAEVAVEVRALEVGEQRVTLLQLLHPGSEVGHVVGVQVVRQGGVEHLGAGVVALAEVLRATHPFDQVRGDRHARLVGGEGGEHRRVPGPLLEQLAGRLDEVPLGGDPGEPHPLRPPTEHVVDQVAELVEQRHHIVVLHQAAREVADQYPLGQPPVPDPLGEGELGGVLVLALARVQVEEDPADPLPGARARGVGVGVGVGAEHVVGGHLLVPDVRLGGVDRDVRQAEQPAGDLEQAGADLVDVEVAADLLGIHAVPLAADQFGVVGGVGRVDRRRSGDVAAQPVEQHGMVAPGGLEGQLRDPVDEGGDRLAGADHHHLGGVVGPAAVAEQLRHLPAHREQLPQHGIVVGPAAVEELDPQRPADGRVLGEGDVRHCVGIVGGHRDQAVLVGRMGIDPVLRKTGQLLRRHPHRPHVGADRPTHLLTQVDLAAVELP